MKREFDRNCAPVLADHRTPDVPAGFPPNVIHREKSSLDVSRAIYANANCR